MMIEYDGGMKFVARHRGLELVSDQPEDGGGENTALNPTEIFVASLGMCIGVYVVGFAKRHDIPVAGLTIEVEYQYAEDPRRISAISVRAKMPEPVAGRPLAALQRVAEHCLVHRTLLAVPKITIEVG